MSDYAIAIEDVVKTFKRFSRPAWRAIDALGLKAPRSKYDEFIALNGITLSIRRGEKVALIGRNGAGKSTLLRIIAGQMLPDRGKAVVNGKVQALMELGTGFHPDFTGLENIRSALAYQGLIGRSLQSAVDEIVDFTELEEFISRPVREYSSGMYARLAFAVATTVTPDILIIDEILGAGDAYFVGKCIQRMKALTREGVTVLFVSHDMSAVQLLCDRGVWIEKGSVKADGDLLPVSKSYLASVREDEEMRARARSASLSNSAMKSAAAVSIYRMIGLDGSAPAKPLRVSQIRYGAGAETLGEIRPDDATEPSRLIVEPGFTNWSNVELIDGEISRSFGAYGGKFVHAPWQIDWSGAAQADRWLEIRLKPEAEAIVSVECFEDSEQSYQRLGVLEFSADRVGEWQSVRFDAWADDVKPANEAASLNDTVDVQPLSNDDRYGAGPIKITGFGFFDASGERRHTLITGEVASAIMTFHSDSAVCNPVAVIAIYRPDGTCALQVTSNRTGLELGQLHGSGQIKVFFEPLLLGPGDYIVSIALFKEMNLASRHEAEAHDLHDRCYVLKVLPPAGFGVEIGIVNQPATWEVAL